MKSMRPWNELGVIALLGVVASTAFADVSLPWVIDSNMVLQRGQRLPIWGWAAPGERVTVEFAGKAQSTRASAKGQWQVKLAPLPASSQPAGMVITGANRLVLTNILVGEVWLCSGQSNMEKPIGQQPGQHPVPNHLEELAQSDYPHIRLFKAERIVAATPQQDVKSRGWLLCNSNSHETLKFSAAGYFFGRKLHRELGVPIGLMESAWGGTRVEPWTPPVGFARVKALKGKIELPAADAKVSNRTPTAIYNSMIHGLAPFAIRGAIWYQGESNTVDDPDGAIYADKMEALIKGWREVWGQGAFPFYYVQLAPYNYYSDREKPRVPTPDALPAMWEAQAAALRVPHTGIASTMDLVDNLADIHPINKQDVGLRLAYLALARDYGRRDLVDAGPTVRAVKFKASKALVQFEGVGQGLRSRDGQPLNWFTVAGSDGRFLPAQATIVGPDRVEVSTPEVPTPVAVRLGWSEKANPNLVNSAGLPAYPFRSDRPGR
jgi:sialate O-acetylesterase